MRSFLFILMLTGGWIIQGCKSDSKSAEVPEIAVLEKQYTDNPTDDNFNAILSQLADLIGNTEEKEGKGRFIEKGIALCKENKKDHFYHIFTKEYIKFFGGDEKSADYLWELSEYLSKSGSMETSDILKSGFKSSFPKDKRAAQVTDEQLKVVADLDALVRKNAEAIFVNPNETGLNTENVIHYIDVCEAIVLAFPQEKMAGEYLFRAAEMSRSIRSFQKSLSLYDWILTSYPQFDKSAMVFFLRGFIYENEMKQKDKAADIYKKFLEKYPNDPMIPDVRFLLDNIDKSEDEMLKLIEERQKLKSSGQ